MASDTFSSSFSALDTDYQQLRQRTAAALGMALNDVSPTDNLLQLGLDSMQLMQLMHWFRQRGYRIALKALYQQPCLAQWHTLMEHHAEEHAATPRSSSTAGPCMTDGTPFPLTPVQHAYLIGRTPGQPLGGVGCHLYQEFDGHGLTAARLDQALAVLIARHPMLHVAFRADGQQYYRPQPFWNGTTVHDLRHTCDDARDTYLAALRQQLGHRRLDVEQGETFDFQLSLLPDGAHRLHVNIDLLIMDASSFTLFFDELSTLLAGGTLLPRPADYDFRSYLHHYKATYAAAIEQAKAYWLDKCETLPLAPQLPLACDPATLPDVRITRRRHHVSPSAWEAFVQQTRALGVTPTMALATCFAAVLARWSGQSRLLLNLTIFDRLPLHDAVEGMLADFTNILPLDMDCHGSPLAALIQHNQQTFASDREHSAWSGVDLLRELKKRQRHPHGAPVVFTSNLGSSLYATHDDAPLGEPAWGISQTPQVWLDHLAFEHRGEVILQWDSNEALFPTGMVATLFDAYTGLVDQLCRNASAWTAPVPELMPEAQRAVRMRVNATQGPVPKGLLHQRILDQAQRSPSATAVISAQQCWSYAELVDRAQRCAQALVTRGVTPGDTVAISMPKGPGQVVAVLGTLLAGGVYVPVAADQPLARRNRIYHDAHVRVVLVCADHPLAVGDNIPCVSWQDTWHSAPLPSLKTDVSPLSPAYIIYTSGSTGVPKGVVVAHRSALNTCIDINHRYHVGPHDRVLALSALHFDLSVYDLFGVLGAGGALVMTDEHQRRDPDAWCTLIERHGITLWNSVPALFDMLMTWCEGFGNTVPARLRTVMLSGDWIDRALPARYRAFNPDGQFVAMGGATEASIWSNAFDVTTLPSDWRTIPYGFPLTNQCYRVVDTLERDCPDDVPGELWIGGIGVAEGYYLDPERSAAQFITRQGKRWYRTGDMGCYWPDGTLVFLGRRDTQVKVGGYRIELGEIDAALARIPGVARGVTVALGEQEKTLAAFAVAEGEALSVPLYRHTALPDHYAALLPTPLDASSNAELPDNELRWVTAFLSHHIHHHLDGQHLSPCTAEQLIAHNGLAPHWAPVLDHWLHLLDAQHAGKADTRSKAHTEQYTRIAAGVDAQRREATTTAHHARLRQIMREERSALELLNDPVWSPEALALRSPCSARYQQELTHLITTLAERLERPVRVIEVGARSARAAVELLTPLTADQIDYVGLEDSSELARQANERLTAWPHARVEHTTSHAPAALAHTADIVWSHNALHRLLPNNPALLAQLDTLAAPGGLIYLTEYTRLPALALLSTLLLSPDHPEQHLCSKAAWQTRFAATRLEWQHSEEDAGQLRVMLRAPSSCVVPSTERLKEALAAQLPPYMVPSQLHFLDALPLTANGKIDRRALMAQAGTTTDETSSLRPQGDVECYVARLWQAWLALPSVSRDTDFFLHGGDSLMATRLIGELHQAGYRATLAALFNAPTLAGFAATLESSEQAVLPPLQSDPDHRDQPFPLTEVQQAYLVGRQPGLVLSGVGAHFFVEFSVQDLDVGRLERAWNALIARHDMLRAVIRDQQQCILTEVPHYTVAQHYLSTEQDITSLRETLSHQVIDPTQWPTFDLQVGLHPRQPARLWLCLDNLFLDGLSMQLLLSELEQCYQQPERQRPAPPLSFRDYRMALADQPLNQNSIAYWQQRLDTLPDAPQLPLKARPDSIGAPHFVRLKGALDADDWTALKARAAQHRLTPSALLLTAYASVLSAWSERQVFTLNLTLFDRQPLHPQINQILGDFTSLMLLEWHPHGDWQDSAEALQRQLRRDLEHRDVSALWVMRQRAQRLGLPATPMPVVFTSALGFAHDNFLAQHSWLKAEWGISQTPQVWLDNQVYESEGELRFHWDAVEALFDKTLLNTMFEQFQTLLRQLSRDENAWTHSLARLIPRRNSPRQPTFATNVPSPSDARATQPSSPSPAQADAVALIRSAFQHVVGHPIDVRQHFFEAGANSLSLVQLHIHLQQQAFPSLTLLDLFSWTSPYALAQHVIQDTEKQSPAPDSRRERHLMQRQRRHKRSP
ncbi:non-ribosomal peptide synthetase [Zymobacter palmae]|uniref:Non-ribosomal peptide synthetase modules n=1 Tax=Zymobacter palmae TaxID=33074 RepID=A0A348HD74_9GAMM|nr:non-ribosomal peptide synthetase [Zymobacter palmae]BBG29576.1 non-ribosomal peptide synthetase modules [Zymobacter palmae]